MADFDISTSPYCWAEEYEITNTRPGTRGGRLSPPEPAECRVILTCIRAEPGEIAGLLVGDNIDFRLRSIGGWWCADDCISSVVTGIEISGKDAFVMIKKTEVDCYRP